MKNKKRIHKMTDDELINELHPACKGVDHQYNPVTLDGKCVTCGCFDPSPKTPKHTPPPWTQKETFHDEYMLYGEDGLALGQFISASANKWQSKANAAFIVKAVNCHAELVEAAKIAYQFFNTEANTPDENGMVVSSDSMVRVVLRKMREAIAKAEGK